MKIKIPKKKSSVINEGTLNEALHAYIDRSKFPKRLILENLRQKEKLFIKQKYQGKNINDSLVLAGDFLWTSLNIYIL